MLVYIYDFATVVVNKSVYEKDCTPLHTAVSLLAWYSVILFHTIEAHISVRGGSD